MKHIVLLFLSEVHLNRDRTLSVSRYKNLDGTMIYCVQTNESAVRRTADVLQKQGDRLDCLFYFSTKRTQEEICYIDDVGDERTMTHEDLFLERVRSFVPHCIRIDYDERSQTEESIRQVLQMADTIRTFMEELSWQPQEVALHADFTGGFRHASMMMLSVMQLLKYRGIRTMGVLYSNRYEEQVENVNDIYRMFNLISGADEFINFGSTREIMAYMEGAKQTAETKLLLETMRDFTNAVRICRTGKIAPLAKKLQEALRNFEQAGAVSLQEKIFLRILEVFKWEYGSLLKEDFTNFDIIRWCVEKGYLQQAMTLCSEWIPREIVGRRIFYPVKDSIIADCNRQKANYQTWQQYFLNALTVERWQRKRKASLKTDGEMPTKEAGKVPSKEKGKASLKKDLEFPRKEYRRLTFKGYRIVSRKQYWQERLRPADWKRQETRLRTMVRVFECTGKFSSVSKFFKDDAEPVEPLLEELNGGHRALFDLKRGRLTGEQFKEKLPRIDVTLWAMYRQAAEDPDFAQTPEEYFKTRAMGDVYEFLKMAPYELFQILLRFHEGGDDDLPSEEKAADETLESNLPSPENETLGDDMISAEHETSDDDVISEESRFEEALEKDETSEENLSHSALDDDSPSEGYIFGIYCEDDLWNNRQANYLRLMNNGEAGYIRPAEATLEILYNYYQIRIERNRINHANDGDSLSTEAIKDLVLQLLRRMETIVEKK
ncbi:TM1812 family CRISPR-associated protein [Megasphaera massiliensis]|uniref:TM1812 family CRISPR-associated protein n=1 Tax=Megasphaera massiliensis TaxID=1232428 RepID=UPI00210CA0A8|nr:TM1812 family CRISPR-associated protein [Megasphaera massiliensis]MCQ5209270.1 TM1812 family CRISPR-associated protein [Megasphaera massiliensis]